MTHEKEARELGDAIYAEASLYNCNYFHLKTCIDKLVSLASPPVQAREQAVASHEKLWLWKNGDHFLAFRHLYPCFTPGGDPQVLGEPFGWASLRPSFDRSTK